jgi:hypothetical protein
LQGSGPWYLVDGSRVVFADKAAILGAGPIASTHIDQTELGTAARARVWTGWAVTYQYDCNGWTSPGVDTLGTAGSTEGGAGWAESGGELGPPACFIVNSIYCFER